MLLSDLNGKRVCILGYGREGKATVEAIEHARIHANITIADKNHELRIMKYATQLGDDYLKDLDKFDIIIKSPGIHPNATRKAQSATITNSTQIFLDECTARGSLVIGITGTKGKSTTSALIAAILIEAGKDCHLVGNIGMPAITYVGDAKKNTIFVQEMSSYQLMNVTSSPKIAVVTSFFPEHLNYHGTLEAYREAKTNIARFQMSDDVIFFAAHDDGARGIAEASAGTHISYDENDAPVPLAEMKLLGVHNLLNAAGAAKVCTHLGVDIETQRRAIKQFTGLPHRLEFVGEKDGIRFVDDAISTTPQSAIAALDALGNDVTTIFLGGEDRGSDFTALAKRIRRSNVCAIAIFPESGKRIIEALRNENVSADILETASMEEAMTWTKERTPKGKICLLSPASPSYGLYKNFEERGADFKRLSVG